MGAVIETWEYGFSRNELERYSRFLVLDSIKRAQILDYLKIPRTLDELVKHFEWEYPSKYVDDLMEILVDDKVIFHKKGRFVINYNINIEKPNVKFIEDFNEVFKIYASGIPNRLKGEYFEYTGRLALFKWDSVLAGQIYQALRDSAWNFINPVDIAGSKLLDVGCGPGYETADKLKQWFDVFFYECNSAFEEANYNGHKKN
ncbi:MAG: hypothetical protein ACTSXA_15240 [Candidatus Heimdallarchaeota archaeon]